MSATSPTATAMAGVPDLTKLITRRERIRLPIWCYALIASVAGTAYSFKTLYATESSRQEFADGIGKNPALAVLYGKPFDLTTIGGLTTWRMGVFGAALLAVMSIVTVNRHTRAEEEAGRFELIGAGAVGRHAPLIAVLRVVLGTQLAIGAIIGLVLVVLGEPASGSFLLGLSIAAGGWIFAGVAAITVQLTDFARSASGLAFSVLGAAYLIRAVGDGSGANGPTWLTWLSPLGWSEQTQPYAGDRWWILALMIIGTAALITVAFRIAARRDLGSGIFPARPGPASAGKLLNSVSALSARMQRGNLLGWAIGLLIGGAVLGSIADSIGELLGSSARVQQLFERMGGQTGIENAYLASAMNIIGLVVACYAIQTTVRLHTEETSGRLEPLLATATSRLRWATSHLTYPLLGSALLLLTAGAAAGLAHGARSADLGTQLAQLITAALIQLPAVWLVAALTVATYGLAPTATAYTGWFAVGICILLQELGPILKLSHWITDISPFAQVPKAPGVPIAPEPLLTMTALAALLLATGFAGLRRRDIR
ncbi:MAG TPA: ABC transporter permease [Actinospica sp.]|jgi:ABC-2 type transport system permease protein|nr:ABC transporter permease [Actinospica sp.]